MPVVPSHTRWEMIRLISHAMTRSTRHRSVTCDAHQLLHRQSEGHVVGHGGEVVGAVGERDDLIVVPVLAELLETRVEVADVRDTALDRLALELDHQSEHAMSGRMLGADVHQHVLGAEIFVEVRRPVRARSAESVSDAPRRRGPGWPSAISTVRRLTASILARRAPAAHACPREARRTLRRCSALPWNSGLRGWRPAPGGSARPG